MPKTTGSKTGRTASPRSAPGCLIAVVGDGRRHTPADQRLLYRRIAQLRRDGAADLIVSGAAHTGADWFVSRAQQTHGWRTSVIADPLARVVDADFLFVLAADPYPPAVRDAVDLFVCLRGTFGLQRL